MHGRSLVKRHVLKKIELRPLISGFDFAFVGGTESVRGFPTALRAFKPSSSECADRGRSIIQVSGSII